MVAVINVICYLLFLQVKYGVSNTDWHEVLYEIKLALAETN